MSRNKDFEKYAYRAIKKFIPILLLQRHTFELEYGVGNPDSLMECIFNYPYLNVTIKYGDKVLEKWNKRENIYPYILHEMCHPITDPFYSKATQRHVSKDEILDERERLTDLICNIALKAYEDSK